MMGSEREKQGKGVAKIVIKSSVAWSIATFYFLVIIILTMPVAVGIFAGLTGVGSALGGVVMAAYIIAMIVVYIILLRWAVKNADKYVDSAREELREFTKWLTEGGGNDRETP